MHIDVHIDSIELNGIAEEIDLDILWKSEALF